MGDSVSSYPLPASRILESQSNRLQEEGITQQTRLPAEGVLCSRCRTPRSGDAGEGSRVPRPRVGIVSPGFWRWLRFLSASELLEIQYQTIREIPPCWGTAP